MNILFSDVKDNINDLCQNFNVTTIDAGNIERQANRAFEYVQRRLGLPSDKQFFSFYYYDDMKYYDCPEGFNELLGLFYNTDVASVDKNNERNRWDIVKDINILNSTANAQVRNRLAFTSLNGQNQLLLKGRNVQPGSLVNAFDVLTGLTLSSDISGQIIDNYVYKQGSGSLKFNIGAALSATSVSFTGNWDIRQPLLNGGVYRLYIDFPTGTKSYFSNIEVQLQSSAGNYFSMTTTTQADGTAWTENVFDLVSFSLANASTTGSPDASLINKITVILNHSGSFAAVSNIRIDYMYQMNPDYMDCVYYSAFKGTDSTGTIPKIILTEDSDICYFGAYAPDLIDAIALRAALKLWPQLRSSEIFWQMYKSDFTDTMNTLSRSYPRARTSSGTNQTVIRR